MNIAEMIRELKKAHEDNKLVVFIGAGVSRNSNLPLWQDLVRTMDIALENTPDASRKYSNDELLRIPQFLYESNASRYYEIIEELYGKWPEETNSIIDHVLELNPHHIITTNFDFLVELSLEKMKRESYIEGHRRPFFAIIRKDDDLIGVNEEQLFIKMHGDTTMRDDLVLKEDDYLGYSQSHIIIETVIKSLLIDHTFLFIGYGIGDYNLKLIMNWVENLVKKNQPSPIARRPHFFFNSDEQPINQHEITYFENRNIQVVNAGSFPENIKNLELTDFENDLGNNCLRLLKYLKQGPYPQNSLEFVNENTAVFSSQRMILYEDLLSVLGLVPYNFCPKIGNALYCYDFNSESFKNLETILKKCGIDNTITRSDLRPVATKAPVISGSNIFEKSTFYNLVLEFDFSELKNILETEDESMQLHLFILLFCGDIERSKQLTETIAGNPRFQDYVQQIIFMINAAQNWNWDEHPMSAYQIIDHLTEKEKIYITPLRELVSGCHEFKSEFVDSMQQIKQKYNVYNKNISSEMNIDGYPNPEFQALRTRLWDRITYYIINGVYTFGCMRSKAYLDGLYTLINLYIDTLLFLQSPRSQKGKYAEIPIEKLDIFMLLAYTKSENFVLVCNSYDIENLCLDNESINYIIKVLQNVANEQKNCIRKDEAADLYLSQVINMCVSLLELCTLSIEHTDRLSQALTNILMLMMEKYNKHGEAFMNPCYGRAFSFFKRIVRKADNDSLAVQRAKELVIEILLHFTGEQHDEQFSPLYEKFLKPHWILFNLCEALSKHQIVIDESDTCEFIQICMKYNWYSHFTLLSIYPVCSSDSKLIIENWAKQKVDKMSSSDIFNALCFNILDQPTVESRLLHLCEDFCKRNYADHIKHSYENPLYVLLRLFENKIIDDVSQFKTYKDCLPLFSFVCFPQEFDFQYFEIDWHSWLDLPLYQEIAISNAYDVLKEKFEKAISDGTIEGVKKVYYRFFFTPNIN